MWPRKMWYTMILMAAAVSATSTGQHIATAHGITVASRSKLVGPRGACFTSCQLPLGFLKFEDMNPGPQWVSLLESRLFMSSLAMCMSAYCTSVEVEEGWEQLGVFRDLVAPGVAVPELPDVLDRVGDRSKVPVIDVFDHMGQSFKYTVLPTEGNYHDGERTKTSWANQTWLHCAFGASMYLLLGLMTLMGICNRILAVLASRAAAKGEIPPTSSRLYTWYRRDIGTPAMMGYRHVQAWGILSIPTRPQSLMILAYIGINITFSCIMYDVFYRSMYFYGKPEVQLGRMIADRTGIMSFYNMVIMWLLAGRNDVLIWITGWSFQSLNLFHRWTARVALLQALVHSIIYTWLEWGSFWLMMRTDYWATGVYATVAMSLFIPLSLRPIREKMYEAFLWVHIGLSIVLLYFLWDHVVLFGYVPMITLCMGIWAFDRLVRLGRIAVLSFRALTRCNTSGVLTAVNPGLLRLSVTSSVRIHPRPGDYYFLYSATTPWENHPFTLASWDQTNHGTVLHFLVAPQAGWTRKLSQQVAAPPMRQDSSEREPLLPNIKGASFRVLLEGPYGQGCPIVDYDHVLLLAGGSGIAAVLPYITRLAESQRKHKVTLIWTARNAEYVADVLQHELAQQRTAGMVVLQLALTKETPRAARGRFRALGIHTFDPLERRLPWDSSRTHPAAWCSVKQHVTAVHPAALSSRALQLPLCITVGRPDMREVLDNAIAGLGERHRLAVLACGPGAMMDDLRREIAVSYGTKLGQVSGERLQYFEESFTW